MTNTARLAAVALFAMACGTGDRSQTASAPRALPAAQQEFWTQLSALYGRAYEGTVTEGSPGDSLFRRARLVMHVRTCSAGEIRIPFHAGDDRSRTWVVTPTDSGLRLKHDIAMRTALPTRLRSMVVTPGVKAWEPRRSSTPTS